MEIATATVANLDGLVAVVKADCPTCRLVAPVLTALGRRVAVYSEDDDAGLELSWHLDLDTVPTLLRFESGTEKGRIVGWDREAWRTFTCDPALGDGLPEYRPGCGSKSVEPGVASLLAERFSGAVLRSRRVELGAAEDESEALFDRGWTDGLPVVAPTPRRVLAMLAGTSLPPDQVVAVVPPDLVPVTVEKVAVNAVLAGCRPEYLPFVLAAVSAACTDEFNVHGLLATTYFSGPMVVANGPLTRAIGMNSGGNALGQGNRANATIGRALQLVVRNVGGGRPGGVDRATLGNPGKYTFCFAEDEVGSPWESLALERGFPASASTITLFAGAGVTPVVDQLSRSPESLARSFAACLRMVNHPKLVMGFDAVLVVSPEHAGIFRMAGWDKARLRAFLMELLQLDGASLVRGADGIDEGVPARMAGAVLPKFRPDGLLFVHAGGTAGRFSAIIGGWVSGPTGSSPVTMEVKP